MEQKVIKVGNSMGIILPQLVGREIGIKPGDVLDISLSRKKITLSPKVRRVRSGGVNAQFMRMLDEFIQDHDDVLKELAKR